MSKSLNNLLVNYIHDRELKRYAIKYIKGRLIDIGCGTKPYAQLLKPYVKEHIGVDHEGTFHSKVNIDLFGTACDIPAPDASFDSALCTAVLEHLEEPEQAIRECYRILKPNSYAIYSVPFFWHLHEEPRDFYRYSKYGLRYLFEKAGFEIVEIKALSGFWVTFGQEFVYYIWRFRRGGKINPLWWIIPLIGMVIQFACFLLNMVDRSYEFTWTYMVVVRKRRPGNEIG